MVVAGGLPPPCIPPLEYIDIIIIIIIRRPNGEALERRTRPEAEARGEVRGGGSPPATTIHYYNRRGEALERRTRPKAE